MRGSQDSLANSPISEHAQKPAVFDISKLTQANAAILDKKDLLLVTDNVTNLDVAISDFRIITKTEDEAIELFRKKDSEMLQMLRDGRVLFGEDKIIGIIKKCVSRF